VATASFVVSQVVRHGVPEVSPEAILTVLVIPGAANCVAAEQHLHQVFSIITSVDGLCLLGIVTVIA